MLINKILLKLILILVLRFVLMFLLMLVDVDVCDKRSKQIIDNAPVP